MRERMGGSKQFSGSCTLAKIARCGATITPLEQVCPKYGQAVVRSSRKAKVSIRARLLLILVGLAVVPVGTLAQTDEIQVYDAEIAEPGVFNLMIHSNFTPIGRTAPEFPGAIVANDSLNGAAEWAYGVKPWFEQGLYLPVYSIHSENHNATINGFKIRELFVRPHAQVHKFFYGLNFEFSVNALYWESRRITSEFRPIIVAHLH